MRITLTTLYLLSLCIGGTILSQVPGPADAPKEEEELEEPTCVFSGMTWQGASIDGLGYFIEGEEKGDFVSVFLHRVERISNTPFFQNGFYDIVDVEF